MAFLFLGLWGDRKLGFAMPWCTLAGTVVGGTAAFYLLYKEVFVKGKNGDDRK